MFRKTEGFSIDTTKDGQNDKTYPPFTDHNSILISGTRRHFCKDFTNKYYFSQDSNKEGSRVTWNEMTTTLRLTHSLILPRLGSPPAGCECCEVNESLPARPALPDIEQSQSLIGAGDR